MTKGDSSSGFSAAILKLRAVNFTSCGDVCVCVRLCALTKTSQVTDPSSLSEEEAREEGEAQVCVMIHPKKRKPGRDTGNLERVPDKQYIYQNTGRF